MFDTSRTEELCRKMDDFADEDHTHHLTLEEMRDYRANWWIRSNKVGSDTMPVRHRPDFKHTHCLPCNSSEIKRMQPISKDGKAIPHLGGIGKIPGGTLLMSIISKTDPVLIDQGNLLKSDWDTFSRYDSQNESGAVQLKIR